MTASDLSLVSPFSPAECAGKLQASIDLEPHEASLRQALDGTHEVIGLVRADTIRLRRRVPASSLFQPSLQAHLRAHGTGTLLEGTVALSGAGRAFVLGGIIVVDLIGTIIFIGALLALTRGQAQPWTWVGLALPVLLVGGIVPLWAMLRRRQQLEVEFLTRFLEAVIEARPAR